MKPIKSLYYLEFKKLSCFWNLATLFILFALLLGIAQLGIIENKKELSEIGKRSIFHTPGVPWSYVEIF